MPPALPSRPAEGATDAERAQLGAVCERLAGFLSGSEEVFLEAGRRLQTAQGEAQRLVSSTARSSGLEGAAGDPVESLRSRLGQIGGHLEQSRAATSADAAGLGRLIGKVGLIPRHARDYHGIANALRLVAIQTSIENAKSAARLDTVAGDTRRLASAIEPRFDDVLQRAARLGEVAKAARERVLSFMARQGKRAEELATDTIEGLTALQGISGSAAQLTEAAGATSERVSARVSEVLFALQVHDSTRQVIEHVIEELRGLQQDPGESAQRWLSEVAELGRLEARQLGGARERLTAGLDDISKGLFDLSGGISELATASAQLADGKGGELLERVAHGIGESSRLLREQDGEERKLAEAVHAVGETLTDMVGCITSIDRVGHEVKMLSLNALVETCQLASGSAVFASLAREMTELAGQVHEVNQVVGGALEKVASEAMQLDRSWQLGAGKEGSIADDFDQLLATLSQWHGRVEQQARELGHGSEAVAKAVDEVARSLRAQAETAEAMRALEEELQRLAALAAERAGPEAAGTRSKRLLDAAARYTMESERAVHAAASGHAPAASDPVPALAPPPSEGQAGLGDNVELF
jgi:uncharacterized protein YukE